MSLAPHASRSRNPTVATIASLIVPGAGQAYLGHTVLGVAILLLTFVIGFIINFSLEYFQIGQFTLGGATTSWLWPFLAVFWLWNVLDANQRARGQHTHPVLGFFFPTLIIYIIAWQATDVKLDRLVTRFGDAQKVASALIHPDLLQRDTVSQTGRVTFYIPCTDPPQPLPPPSGSPSIIADKSCGVPGDMVTLRGTGFIPNSAGELFWLMEADTRAAQIREGGSTVVIQAGPDGSFAKTFAIPTFAGRNGTDPARPDEQAIQASFTQEVGPIRPSDNFYDLIGKLTSGTPPAWLVSLGIMQKTASFPELIPGKLIETIALGLMATLFSTILAVPLSFFAARNIMARLPAGTAIYYGMRTFLNIVRAIDTVIWGLIIIVWVGLGPFAGMLALTIHSIAALGKLFSEEIEHIDDGPIEAITATGANLFQVVRYGVIPQIIPPFLAYTLLRWDINMRSATVVGFVAGGGIGFFVLETIRKGGYEQYAAALWAVAVVIILVDVISAYWRERILAGDTTTTTATVMQPRPFYRSLRNWVYIILGAAAFVYCWNATGIDLRKLTDPAPTFLRLVGDFLAIDVTPDLLQTVLKQMLLTIFQALIATTLGGLVALPFSFLAAHNLTGRSRLLVWIYYATRALFNVLRSIEALLYVAIFVAWVGIGAFAGALALAITTFALIGKLFSEAIENIDGGPMEAITATGANRLQTIVYAIIPQIVPPFVSYLIYQWDINIRIATIIGFAGGGGIGLLLSTYFGQLQYHKAGTVVAMIVIVVAMMDLASAKIREKMV